MKEKMIIVVGPSAVGKSTFVDRAISELPVLEDTKTYTTRKMREGESEGHPYHFVSSEKFLNLIKEDFFVEWAMVHQNHYGTPHYQISDAWEKGKVIIMDVDVQGALTFKSKYPNALSIFIHPPSIETLHQRLVDRDGKESSDLELRLENAKKELQSSQQFDVQIVNDEFESSYKHFKKIIEEFIEKK